MKSDKIMMFKKNERKKEKMTKEELIKAMAKTGDENTKKVQDLLDKIKGMSGRIADLIELKKNATKFHLRTTCFTHQMNSLTFKVYDDYDYIYFKPYDSRKTLEKLFVDSKGNVYYSNYDFSFITHTFGDTFLVKPSRNGNVLEEQEDILSSFIYKFDEIEKEIYESLEWQVRGN